MDVPLFPADLLKQLPPPAQAAVKGLARQYDQHLRAYQAALEARSAGWPVPTAPHQVLAALRSGERSWARFPYYAQRYGERGRTFTARDSLWLAGLAACPVGELYAQVRWLGQVLSARGMPRWLLECHLAVLHRELVCLAPESGEVYAGLVEAAGRLGEERERWLDDDVLSELAGGFAARVRRELAAQLPEAGRLIAAAVADEQCGVVQAVASLEEWLADRSRFPEEWVEAVGATIRAARGRAVR